MTIETRFDGTDAEEQTSARTPEQMLLVRQQRSLDKIEFLLWIVLAILAFGIYLLLRQPVG